MTRIKYYPGILVAIFLVLTYEMAQSQDPSVIVEFDSQSKGLLMPRMDSMQRNAIEDPSEGLMVYDLSSHSIYYYDGTDWHPLNTPKQAGPYLGGC